MKIAAPCCRPMLIRHVLNLYLGLASAETLVPVTVPSPVFAPAVTAGGDSGHSSVTPDGRFVLFTSTANNLTTGISPVFTPVPAKMNVFLRDRLAGITTLVSPNLDGTGDRGYAIDLAPNANQRFYRIRSY